MINLLSVHLAKRGLCIFILALIAITSASIWLIGFIKQPTLSTVVFSMGMTALLSYSPAVASLVARASLREGIRDISFEFRRGWSVRAMLIGWLWPVLCGSVVYGFAWVTGLAHFRWTPVEYPFGSWGPETLIGLSIYGMTPLHGFATRLLACLLFTPFGCLQSFGEELGWRGYLLLRLLEAKIPAPVFWSGLVWGLWHIPFVLVTASSRNLKESLSVSLLFFVAGTVAGSYLLSYLRLRSGSIWPPVLGHVSNNIVFTLAFNGFTDGTSFLKGELYLVSVALPMVALMFFGHPWGAPDKRDRE